MENTTKKVIYVNDGNATSSFSGRSDEGEEPKPVMERKEEVPKNGEYVGSVYEKDVNKGEMEDGDEESDVMSVKSAVSNASEEGGGFVGGAKRTSLSSVSSEDTIESQALLEIDPMYIRLTKFLETSGTNKKNLADVVDNIASSLKDLNATFDKMNNNLEKILKLQQNSV